MTNSIFYIERLFEYIEDLGKPNLVTRSLGIQAYEHLNAALANIDEGEVLILDFQNIRVMGSSFAGASLIRLLRELVKGEFGEKYILLKNVSPSTMENIDVTIKGHGHKIAVEVINGQEGATILGRLEANLRETLSLVHQYSSLTARDVANKNSGMAINTASTRLKKLFDLHLIRRVEEIGQTGRQHIYQPLML